MHIPRIYEDLGAYLEPNKVLVLFGPRQVGKTTLVKEFMATCKEKYRYDIGESLSTQKTLGSQELKTLKEYAGDNSLLVIDEAHKIPNIGVNLKIIVDNIPGIKLIVTGSSSFDLLGQIGEPLVGRKITLNLFTLSQLELAQFMGVYELKQHLDEWLIFGGYPEVVKAETKEKKIQILEELVQGYLLKDILELDKVKNPRLLVDLLILLAFQVGNEVSLSELGQKLNIDLKTVARYLDLLQKSYILFNLRGYSRNLRNEVTKKSKYYFFDNGVRNAIISSFNFLDKRNDIGALWENFLVIERLKYQNYKRHHANNYFWRTWSGYEIDWVEEKEGKLFAFEFKFNKDKGQAPTLWKETYPDSEYKIITKENYLDFVIEDIFL